MKSTAISTHGQNHAEPARSRAGNPPGSNSHTGYLGQLAAMINSSPHVLAQRNLAQEIQSSPRVQAQRRLASEIDHDMPAAAPLHEDTNLIDGTQGGELVVQRVWKTMGPRQLKWDRLLGGLQWFFHREDDSFSYHIANDNDVPIEIWEMVEGNEGEHLSEAQLDEMGFQEIEFEEHEDRVEYEAPQPEFGPVKVSMVTKKGERARRNPDKTSGQSNCAHKL